jgi:hypothetical protein
MLAPIVTTFNKYIGDALDIPVWEGEIPRVGTDSVEIDLPSEKPVIRVLLEESGLERDWRMDDSYGDEGPLRVEVYGTTRQQVEACLGQIEELLAKDWNAIPFTSRFFCYRCMLHNWTCVQEEGMRTKSTSDLVFRGRMTYDVGIHGEVPT